MKRFFNWKVILILVFTLFLGYFDLPSQTQKSILPFVPSSITDNEIQLGLDLQGGSQLDYKIDLRKVPEDEKDSIVEGVKAVIEKRVNGLGVTEPNIFISEYAGETHIIVELAEVENVSQEDVNEFLGPDKVSAELTEEEKKKVSLEKAKATVGKTIQLEFKEEKTTLDEEEETEVREQAQSVLDRLNSGEEFAVVGQQEQQAFPARVTYESVDFKFADEMPSAIREVLTGLEPGQITSELIETGGDFTVDAETGSFIENKGLGIFKLLETREELQNEIEVDTRHILISYQGSESENASVTRSQDEAKELAESLLDQLKNGASFETLATENTDDAASKDDGGAITLPVTGDGTFAFAYEEAALALTEAGQISDIVETQFGYHIIQADAIRENVTNTQYKYESIVFSTAPDAWQDTGLNGEQFVNATVELDQFLQPYVLVQFNDEGADLFREITARNINKRVAIFVGGELISSPVVQQEIIGGSAVISGGFTDEEARILARDLNTGAIPAPIILTGEHTVGATIGRAALQDSLAAGGIGLLIVMIFMLAYYRLAGLMASIALFSYATILLFFIKVQLNIGIALAVALVLFGYIVTKVLNNRDSGWEKFVSFVLSCFAFFFLTVLLREGITLTLAGVAGIILSIGIAVDANILIFERLKEELREDKPYKNALNSAFARAWSAIRDSNFSTLITCGILYYFGSSLIRGFAYNLAAGILVSMFTAIVITRILLESISPKLVSKNPALIGAGTSKKSNTQFNFIKNSKIWLGFSSVLIIFSIVSISIFGLNLGIDFKGGTLMELHFEEEVAKTEIADALESIQEKVDSGELVKTVEEPATETETEEVSPVLATEEAAESTISAPAEEAIDLTNPIIQASNDNKYIIKTKYLSAESEELVLNELEQTLPTFTVDRFTTIGPTIGSSLLQRAIIAILVALAVIIVYIAIAFRSIPEELSPWKFGLSAIAALAHDMIIVTGVFAVLGGLLNVEIDALFITAMLTVFGYSVNDTIVVFDRLRENLHNSGDSFEKVADNALNQTLARSMNTSLSTLITLVAVLIFGSPSIFYFVLALTIGTAVGTYSSILTATPLLALWTKNKK